MTLSPQTHPFLAHHALGGRPILPLAAAADLMAADLGFPFCLRDLAVERGLVVKGPTRVRIEGGLERRLVEVRPTGREVTAFRCRPEFPGPPPDLPPLLPEPVQLGLDEFYQRLFHGPMLRGISEVHGLSDQGLEGTVRTSTPAQLAPGDSRACWQVDVLAVDSAFQLAIFWAVARRGQALLPQRIDELAMRRPLGPGPVAVALRRREETGEEAAGTIVFGDLEDPDGWIEGIRGRLVPLSIVEPRRQEIEQRQ